MNCRQCNCRLVSSEMQAQEEGDPAPLCGDCQRAGTRCLECNAAPSALGLCRRHYTQKWGWVCAHLDCQRPAEACWFKIVPLCLRHNAKIRNRGTTLAAAPRPRAAQVRRPIYGPFIACLVDDCFRRATNHGFCGNHKHRRGTGNLAPSRGRRRGHPTAQGYRLIRDRNGTGNSAGYIMEHRAVMEEHIGRPLRDNENVHHKNGIRDDNRVENLELWAKAQPHGQRVRDLVDWIVRDYPEYLNGRPIKPNMN